ncbi:MAG: elongation factor P [Candidatus Pacebacteria bacterium]|nr:elongation factor P [Candidatus Paceibacterota bacterium]
MATLDYDEIKQRKNIVVDGMPYEILESHVARTQKRKPQNQVRMRNLLNGKVVPGTFHASDTAEEAEISKREALFLYANKGEYWFCDPKDRAKRFEISADVLGDSTKYLKDNTTVDIKIFEYEDEEKIIGVTLPIKMTFEVREAPPAIKGNTASGGGKLVTLETGAQVTTPFFIEVGEKIVVNTETGEYVERLKAEKQ